MTRREEDRGKDSIWRGVAGVEERPERDSERLEQGPEGGHEPSTAL